MNKYIIYSLLFVVLQLTTSSSFCACVNVNNNKNADFNEALLLLGKRYIHLIPWGLDRNEAAKEDETSDGARPADQPVATGSAARPPKCVRVAGGPTILNHRCTTCGTLREWRSGRESESLLSFFEPKQEENLFGSGSSGFLGRKIGGGLVMTSRPSNSDGRSACRRAGLCRTEFTRFERNLHKIELRGSFSISTGWAGWCCCTVS